MARDLDAAVGATRFWLQVNRRTPTECWLWGGSIHDDSGYGYANWLGRRYQAHDLALMLATGTQRLPGQHTCHSCHNPPCCNPRHLRYDSPASNVADTVAAGRNVRGTKNPAARFTDEQVETIRQRRAAGASVRLLAAEYQTSAGAISRICTGKRWTHVSGPVVRPYERTDNGQG
jgi:hypothetical protein